MVTRSNLHFMLYVGVYYFLLQNVMIVAQ